MVLPGLTPFYVSMVLIVLGTGLLKPNITRLVGSLYALAITKSTMSVFTILGIIMLLGLVAKNAILIVEFAKEKSAQGATPRDVLERFTAFVRAVKADLPESRIAFVSIKPSPSRAGMLAAVRETNELIKASDRLWQQSDDVEFSIFD